VVPLGGEMVLVALDSARWGDDPHATAGRLGPEQLKSARELCREHQKAGKATVLAFHHHVLLPPERIPSDAHVARMPLADADQVIRLLAELPVAAVLHGHATCAPERIPSDAHVARMPLADADQVIRLLAELPVAAVLHGHRHCAFRVDVPGVKGPVPILCAGSVSRVTDEPVRRARAYVYELDAGGVRGVEALVSGAS